MGLWSGGRPRGHLAAEPGHFEHAFSTSSNWPCSSRYFWLESALIGEVYTTRWPRLSESATAYCATTVLPALVCAETSTDSPRSTHASACRWNGSSSNGKSSASKLLAGSSSIGSPGCSGGVPGGSATS